jgi:ABC-type glutathione transport system ATPase component
VACDEPASGLDVCVQAQVLDLLAGLQAGAGAARRLISHDPATGRRIARRVAVIGKGRIVKTGARPAFACRSQERSWLLGADARFAALAVRPQRGSGCWVQTVLPVRV